MMDESDQEELEQRLDAEIERWRQKLAKPNLEELEGDKGFISNIKAYYKDSKHFYEEDKLIESFEALVWAWAWLEIGKKYNFVD